ncbi:amidohydrolase family protein [Parasphingorhabdus sp.]|uniref:amidohydrolase family protein n=1 Tax=Parasphingorhabdus sp. TaxID=2709688 RepID=UPI003A945723
MTGAFIEPPIIDTHCHVFVKSMPFTDTAWTRPDYEYPAEAYLKELDTHGIAFGVVTAASLYGDYNDYTLAVLAQHKRLRATVMLDPDTKPAELVTLRQQGVCGVRFQISPHDSLPDLEGYQFRRFIRRLADAGMHIELNLNGPQLARMLPALEAQGIDVVVDHFGLLRSEKEMEGEGFLAMLRAIDKGRTWVKISAGFRLPPDSLQSYAQRLLEVAGPERMFWGSDAPFVGWEDKMSYAQTLETYYHIIPDARVRRQISDAAMRFYFY